MHGPFLLVETPRFVAPDLGQIAKPTQYGIYLLNFSGKARRICLVPDRRYGGVVTPAWPFAYGGSKTAIGATGTGGT
jgi:hypothetical protein